MAIAVFSGVPQIVAEVALTAGQALNANTTTEVSLTVAQATPEMTFVVTKEASLQAAKAGAVLSDAFCAAAGTVVLVMGNLTGSTITLPAMTFHVIGF